MVGTSGDGDEPGPRCPAGRDRGRHRGGDQLVVLAAGPEATERPPAPGVHLPVTREGECVGLARGDGDHLGRHLRAAVGGSGWGMGGTVDEEEEEDGEGSEDAGITSGGTALPRAAGGELG